MDMIYKIALFYAVAGVVLGTIAATSKHVTVTIRRGGKQLPFARVIVFFVVGLLWPMAAYQYLTRSHG